MSDTDDIQYQGGGCNEETCGGAKKRKTHKKSAEKSAGGAKKEQKHRKSKKSEVEGGAFNFDTIKEKASNFGTAIKNTVNKLNESRKRFFKSIWDKLSDSAKQELLNFLENSDERKAFTAEFNGKKRLIAEEIYKNKTMAMNKLKSEVNKIVEQGVDVMISKVKNPKAASAIKIFGLRNYIVNLVNEAIAKLADDFAGRYFGDINNLNSVDSIVSIVDNFLIEICGEDPILNMVILGKRVSSFSELQPSSAPMKVMSAGSMLKSLQKGGKKVESQVVVLHGGKELAVGLRDSDGEIYPVKPGKKISGLKIIEGQFAD